MTAAADRRDVRVLDAIDIDGLLAFLAELVPFQSLSGEETAVQRHIAAHMATLGLDVDIWDIDFDTLRAHPAYSAEVERTSGLGVVGRLGAARGPRLIFNGHVDVVPAGDEANWRFPPWRATVQEGRVYGRGALDMKGALCCAIYAAAAIQRAGVHLAGQLLVQSVIGEEDGGAGTLATIVRGYRADGAVVVEPTGGVIAPAQAGALNFRITVPGRAAHGALRAEGVSAIDNFIPIYRALQALEARRNRRNADPLFADYTLPYPICIGTVRAGTWASTVAETLVCEGRYGVAVGEDLVSARRELETAVADVAAAHPWLRDHPPRLAWWGGQFAPAATDAADPLVTTLAAAHRRVTGRPARLQGMPYGADMRLLVNEGGIPTVLYGPGDVRHAHQPDEFVPVADLLSATRALAIMAVRFCGVMGADAEHHD